MSERKRLGAVKVSSDMMRIVAHALLAVLLVAPVLAADWPEWRGKGRRGVWAEDGILDKFPAEGLTPSWRTPVGRNDIQVGEHVVAHPVVWHAIHCVGDEAAVE